ncbi:MAG: hypothetical protein AB1505_30230 [Candidatus Latescibacterota bacterium]
MAQPSETTPTRPALPADLPWGIQYLRLDIQDLRLDLRHEVSGLRAETRERRAQTGAALAGLRGEVKDLRGELNDLRSETATRFDGLRAETNMGAAFEAVRAEIKDLRADTAARFESAHSDVAEQARRFESRFTWTITTVVAVGGIIIAAIKL